MRKKIKIMIVIFLLISLVLFFIIKSYYREEELKSRRSIFCKAVITEDLSLCETVPFFEIEKHDCYTYIFRRKMIFEKDISYCNEIEKYNESEISQDIQSCEQKHLFFTMSKEEINNFDCYELAKSSDQDLCEKVKNLILDADYSIKDDFSLTNKEKDLITQFKADYYLNSSLCDEIESEFRRTHCKLFLSDDLGFCEEYKYLS